MSSQIVVSLNEHRLLDRLKGKIAELMTVQQRNHVELILDVGRLLLEAKLAECGNNDQRFNRWLADNEITLRKDERAACMKLAADESLAERARAEYGHCTSARYVLKLIEVSHICETSPHDAENSTNTENTCTQPGIDEPAAAENSDELPGTAPKGAAPAAKVDKRHAVNRRWGELGAAILDAYADKTTRSVWNSLVSKRHGASVARFALESLQITGEARPVTVRLLEPNARLVFPWLNSVFATEYDLRRARDLERLKTDAPAIVKACRPLFANGHGYDRANQCRALFRSACTQEADERRAQEMREYNLRRREEANPQNHPPIVVHGVELWPDHDQPEELRLTYDAARFAYFEWNNVNCALPDSIRERAMFFQQRQLAFIGLDFPIGMALSNFWKRAGRAMETNPDADSKCEFIPRVKGR